MRCCLLNKKLEEEAFERDAAKRRTFDKQFKLKQKYSLSNVIYNADSAKEISFFFIFFSVLL